MYTLVVRSFLLCTLVGIALFTHGQETVADVSNTKTIPVLRFEGAIGPAVSEYLVSHIAAANSISLNLRPPLLVIVFDTPGGLVSSLRNINQSILTSKIPIACLVAPAGARAMSAGTYMLYACHIAAMAPATTLGAATPVQMGPSSPSPEQSEGKQSGESKNKSAMEKKILNDSIAYIRSLAQLRGRNPDWAERAVKEAATLTADEALEKNVITILAEDVTQLLGSLNGWTLNMAGIEQQLDLNNTQIIERPMDWRNQFIATITDPNIAYILMLIGIYGLILEFYSPGIGIAGVIGGISLLVALYAFQLLPINYAGLGLLLLGIVLLVAESMVPSVGIFGLGGAAAFALGSIFLLDTESDLSISLPLVAAVTVTSILFTLWVLSSIWKSRNQAVVSGDEALVGAEAKVITGFEHQGFVLLGGETWAATCDTQTTTDQRVKVIARNKLTLTVASYANDSIMDEAVAKKTANQEEP
jgi:membrane-bound serine protease (ClpP class)